MSEICWILSDMTSFAIRNVEMVVPDNKFRAGRAGAQQLSYYIWPPPDRMPGEGIQLLGQCINSI